MQLCHQNCHISAVNGFQFHLPHTIDTVSSCIVCNIKGFQFSSECSETIWEIQTVSWLTSEKHKMKLSLSEATTVEISLGIKLHCQIAVQTMLLCRWKHLISRAPQVGISDIF
jgi:hypothetical protein